MADVNITDALLTGTFSAAGTSIGVTIGEADFPGSWSISYTQSVVNPAWMYNPAKDLTIDCTLAIDAEDMAARAYYNVAPDAPEYEGYVFPRALIGVFGLTPSVYVWVTSDTELSAEFTLTGHRVLSFEHYSTGLRGTFTLAPYADVRISVPYSGALVAAIPRQDWIAWSKIGSANFTLDRVNDAGERPSGFPGWVYKVIPLGKNIMVYGERFIAMLQPVAEPATTFAYLVLMEDGLLFQDAACGSLDQHRFITSSGDLYSINAKPELKRLGYSEFLLPLKDGGNSPRMSYDAKLKRTFINNGKIGYTLTEEGLGGGPVNLTSCQVIGRDVYAVGPSAIQQVPLNLRTSIFDMGYREPKPLQKITLGCMSPELFQFQVHYRMRAKDEFRSTSWKSFNQLGEGWCNVTGTEFKVGLRTLTAVSAEIFSLTAHGRIHDTVLEREAIK